MLSIMHRAPFKTLPFSNHQPPFVLPSAMPSFPGWPGLHAGTPPDLLAWHAISVEAGESSGVTSLGMLWEMSLHAELIKMGTLLHR
jgi:hypothetical protein